jgi:hypothetical protein
MLAAGGVPTPIRTQRRVRRYSSGVAAMRDSGFDGLVDAPRPGREPVIDEVSVLAETLGDNGSPRLILGRRTGRRVDG